VRESYPVSKCPFLFLVVCLSILPLGSCAVAQTEPERPGIPAKKERVDAALLNVHAEYLEFLGAARQGEIFTTKQALVTVIEDRVIIDMVASTDTEVLRTHLAELGATNIFVANRMVSCQLPILAIEELRALESLQFARPAYATTR
jgi:hypothetical protein